MQRVSEMTPADSSHSVATQPSQQSIQGKCFHPAGSFVEFNKEDIEQSIPARFEQQASNYPDRIAVKTRTQELTYGVLNRAANRLARELIMERGPVAEPIALLLEQGAAVIVSILGVLKAGKFYLPLDPNYPRARNATMLADSQARVIVSNTANLSLAKELAGRSDHIINLDEVDQSQSSADEKIEASVAPENLAYLIYTSGSSGVPKGVVQTHRNVLHDIKNYTNAFHICKDDRLIALTSYSFADTTRTTNAALLNGASLYLFDSGKQGLFPLAEWLARNEITIYRSVPTTFREFVRTLAGEERFPKLRLVYMAGEPVYRRDVDLYKRHFSDDCIFINGMGTTECLTHCWYFVDKQTKIDGQYVPVGHALEDIELLLLGDDGKEIRPGETGEIAVKSRYLSPGYWHRPELTRAAFLSGLENASAERIYLTGDLGMRLEDGCLIHVGRKDFQVKVRGHRIEVAEIEALLLAHGNVRDAIVVKWNPAGSDDEHLVAYVVPIRKPVPTITELRRLLTEQLPDHMVPSAFMFLDVLPTTPNGKLDRRALPLPEKSRPVLDGVCVAPRSRLEWIVAEIWAEVLALDQVGVYDNFFELGGHSLAATRIVGRVFQKFKFEIPLQALLDSPTVAAMAEVVAEHQNKHSSNIELEDILKELKSLSDEEANPLANDDRSPESKD